MRTRRTVGNREALQIFWVEWVKLYGGKFPVVEIQDDIDAGRWDECKPYFLSNVDRFEFGAISANTDLPPFPEFRDFEDGPSQHCDDVKPNVFRIEI